MRILGGLGLALLLASGCGDSGSLTEAELLDCQDEALAIESACE